MANLVYCKEYFMTLTHSAVSYKNTDGSHMETANRLLSHSQLPLYFWNIRLQVLGKYEIIHKLYSQWRPPGLELFHQNRYIGASISYA